MSIIQEDPAKAVPKPVSKPQWLAAVKEKLGLRDNSRDEQLTAMFVAGMSEDAAVAQLTAVKSKIEPEVEPEGEGGGGMQP